MIEITVPAVTYDLTTPDRVLVGWKGAPRNTEAIPYAISAASRLACHWCRREFARQTYTEALEAPYRKRLVLQESPVNLVVSVEVDGDPIAPDQYKVFGQAGMLLRTDKHPWVGPVEFGGYFGMSPEFNDQSLDIIVEYEAGYVSRAEDENSMDLLPEIEEAVVETTRDIVSKGMGQATGDVTKTKVGSFETEYGLSDSMVGSGSGYWANSIGDPSLLWLPLSARRLLLPHRRLLV